MSNIRNGFVHTVFFWLKNHENTGDQAKLKAGLNELANINLIKHAYIGLPADTSRSVIDTSYSFSITFIFDNKADQDAYQVHPDHLAFVDKCSHLWDHVIVYDAVS